jgi:glycosyltransferase involved in cell wall biosynthesis
MHNDILIITPVFNDWDSLAQLLEDLEKFLHSEDLDVDVLAVDDGSSQPCPKRLFPKENFSRIKSFNILHLTRNIGHQRAIAIGLAYAHANSSYKQVIVMDSDGEDRIADVINLVHEQMLHPAEIIFAQRKLRSDSLGFRVFYWTYKTLFRLLTGVTISFGNFSSIPGDLLGRVAHSSEIWNHYAAGILHSRITWRIIPTSKGTRYAGKSHMSFTSLAIHGLSAISVFIDVLTIRLMLASFLIILAGVIGFVVLLCVKFLTPLAIPGWATNVTFGLMMITFQAIIFLVILSFSILNYRSMRLFIPARDYLDFVSSIEKM